MGILVSLIEATSVFLVASYVYCASPALPSPRAERPGLRGYLSLYAFFSAVSIMGNYLGVPVQHGEAIANTRAVGAVLAGLLGGPVLGVTVGATAGLERLTLGGAAGLPGCIATTLEGLAAGLVRRALRDRPDRLLGWKTAAAVTFVGEVVHQLIVLAMVHPSFPYGLSIVREIAAPMILANTLGASAFLIVFHNRTAAFDRVGAASSALALRIAERTVQLMRKGYGPEVAPELAAIVREESGVGAVGITDRERVLAFSGLGADHHLAGGDIASPWTLRALEQRQVVIADGSRERYDCRLSPACPLTAVVVVPLEMDGQVVGTVQLFERAAPDLRITSRKLGEGIAALLSSQLVLARYHEQKTLLVEAELKLLRAQVHPHFLFNALNTIVAVTRTDPGRARELLVHLSSYFRNNLKRSPDVSTLEEELLHVQSYLEIEKARFGGRLRIETAVDDALLGVRLPTFTLQPLVENAIKHGVSRTPSPGRTIIRAYRQDGEVRVEVEDDAGAYGPRPDGEAGHGLRIVERRIKALLGERYGLSVHCVPGERTRVTVRLPDEGGAPAGRGLG
jgi:two-component system LytT family sensor kinase